MTWHGSVPHSAERYSAAPSPIQNNNILFAMEKIEFDIFWSENIRKIEVRSDSLQNSCPKLVGLTPGRAIHFFCGV